MMVRRAFPEFEGQTQYAYDPELLLKRNDAQRWWEQITVQSPAVAPFVNNQFAGDIPALTPEPVEEDAFLALFGQISQQRRAHPRRFFITPRAAAFGLMRVFWLVRRQLCADPFDLDEREPVGPEELNIRCERGQYQVQIGPYTLLLPDPAPVALIQQAQARREELADDE